MLVIVIGDQHNAVSGDFHGDAFAGGEPGLFQPFAAQVEARRAGIALIRGIADGVTAFGFGGWVSLGRDRSHKGSLQ